MFCDRKNTWKSRGCKVLSVDRGWLKLNCNYHHACIVWFWRALRSLLANEISGELEID
jgi:hypothetical protein